MGKNSDAEDLKMKYKQLKKENETTIDKLTKQLDQIKQINEQLKNENEQLRNNLEDLKKEQENNKNNAEHIKTQKEQIEQLTKKIEQLNKNVKSDTEKERSIELDNSKKEQVATSTTANGEIKEKDLQNKDEKNEKNVQKSTEKNGKICEIDDKDKKIEFLQNELTKTSDKLKRKEEELQIKQEKLAKLKQFKNIRVKTVENPPNNKNTSQLGETSRLTMSMDLTLPIENKYATAKKTLEIIETSDKNEWKLFKCKENNKPRLALENNKYPEAFLPLQYFDFTFHSYKVFKTANSVLIVGFWDHLISFFAPNKGQNGWQFCKAPYSPFVEQESQNCVENEEKKEEKQLKDIACNQLETSFNFHEGKYQIISTSKDKLQLYCITIQYLDDNDLKFSFFKCGNKFESEINSISLYYPPNNSEILTNSFILVSCEKAIYVVSNYINQTSLKPATAKSTKVTSTFDAKHQVKFTGLVQFQNGFYHVETAEHGHAFWKDFEHGKIEFKSNLDFLNK